ncbi:AraC family transcriptional regulator [Caldimonas tepidiphila]|uniref:AraC family transcriptional regulator n=1 Tax=Caldimonas tepidiphila TaxID=2315841 RepID=UPI000E5B344D|nr:AraC family transcriptional regulator [Caldimonas tepidiphila]
MEKDSVSMYFVRAALAKLPAAALPRVLAQAGIPAALLGAAQARVPARAFAALWLAVARELDDEFFGLDARRMKVGSFALLCHALLHCGTLERALRQCLRGFAVFLDDIDAELHVEGADCVLRIGHRMAGLADRRFAVETYLVMVHGLLCWLGGRRIAIRAADFAYPAPEHAVEYRLLFSQQLRFDAPSTELRLDARVLALPIVQDEAALKAFLRSAPQSVFLKYRNTEGWSARIRRQLRGSLGAPWPTLDELAARFGVAPATLRRRLEAEGVSYQEIKDALRRDIAIHHLCHGGLSIAEMADLLGFREPSAFHRAFRKWTGARPGDYRAGRAAGPAGNEA